MRQSIATVAGLRPGPLISAVLAVAYGLALALTLEPPADAVPATTYFAGSATAYAAGLAAGLGFMVVGLLHWADGSVRRLGPFAIVAGCLWFAPAWTGWVGGPAIVKSVGMVAAPFFGVVLGHLLLCYPTGRLEATGFRALVGSLYAIVATLTIGHALFYDPFLDLHCWSNCTDNSFLLDADSGIAATVDDLVASLLVAGAALLISVLGWRLGTATRPAARSLWPVVVPGIIALLCEAAYATALLADPADGPESAGFAAIFIVRSLAALGVVFGLAWQLHASRSMRTSVARLVDELGESPHPGSLRAVLGAAVGDPRLEVAYRVSGSDPLVDADGRPTALPSRGRTVTRITRGGQPVAFLVHDRGTADSAALEDQIGPAARLAVENERLQAEVLFHLREITASRARIVETGDIERRRLERDLHDGAQQTLLALAYELRLARAATERAGNPGVIAMLESSEHKAEEALADLRELAHGIYPAVLAEGGLAPALSTLAERAPVPVEIARVTGERFAAPLEATAYLVVAEAVETTARAGGDHVVARVERHETELVVEVDGAGEGEFVDLRDRVGALGGGLVGEAGRLRARIPCA